mmetsp:Transcript_16492/g.37065  ORF Transcript_16492/g.37065 Transcript_16492/m.37065 type:complete len:301 (-) Transcript_16492:184-1086(-)
MDAVVAGVGFGREAELLVVVQYRPSGGSDGGRRRVGRAEDLPAEIRPRQRVCRPRYRVPYDLLPRVGVRRAHGHVETVHDVDVPHLAAVEPSAEFDEVLPSREFAPFLVESGGVGPEFRGAVLGVVHLSAFHRIVPLFAEHFFEVRFALVRDVEFVRFELDRLRRDRSVVSVDVHVLIDRLGGHLSLSGDADAVLRKIFLHDALDFPGRSFARVGLDEHECGVRLPGKLNLKIVDRGGESFIFQTEQFVRLIIRRPDRVDRCGRRDALDHRGDRLLGFILLSKRSIEGCRECDCRNRNCR